MGSTFATELFVKLFGVMPPKPGSKTDGKGAPKTEVLVPNRPAEPGGKVIYHVTPRKKDDRWNIKKEGGARPSAVCENKDEAIDRAREIAKNLPWSQVVIHNKDGKISNEYNYGAAPGERKPQEKTPPDSAEVSAKARPTDDWSDDFPDETESDDGFVDDYEGEELEDENSYTPKTGERVIYHVTPRKKDGKWNVRRRGAERPSVVIENKEPAIERAKEFAKKHSWSQVIIHNQNGKIANEYKYGGPPEASPTDVNAPAEEKGTRRPTAKVDKDDNPARGKTTTRRVVYHVTPRAEDGKWRVKRQGSSRPTRVLNKKEDAVAAAKELAKNRNKGQVIIHTQDGKIAEEFKYGKK
ncbi:MAG: DUF2188 domain-containing protein [Planctomycetes bacterium]|nr:DUF2188 domain-containing protein [Planctomycetota bacterium]